MRTARRTRARPRRRLEGAAAVEFAFVLPLLVIFLLGMIDFGHLFWVVNTMTNAAREGARNGAVQPQATVQDAAKLAAHRYLYLAGLSPGHSGATGSVASNCSLNCPTVEVTGAPGTDTVVVTITIKGSFNNITGFSYAVLPNFANPFAAMTDLRAASEMRWELAGTTPPSP